MPKLMSSWQVWTSGSLEILTHPDWILLFTTHDSICRWSTIFHLAAACVSAQNARDVGLKPPQPEEIKTNITYRSLECLNNQMIVYQSQHTHFCPIKLYCRKSEDPIALQEGKEVYKQQLILTRNVPRGEEEGNSGAASCCKDCFCNDYFIQIS